MSNEDLPYLYSYYLDGQIKWDEMGETCGTHEREEKCLQGFFVEKHEGKRRLVRPRLRWADDFKVGLK